MDPYVEVCRRLEEAGVRYVIIGAFGINLYSTQAGTVLTTADCDILLEPTESALQTALRIVRSLGFELDAGDEPLLEDDPVVVAGILRTQARVTARRQDAVIDLMLESAGPKFPALWAGQRRFELEGVTIRVADLRDLIRSKEIADRPKDRAFLEAYREAMENILDRMDDDQGPA